MIKSMSCVILTLLLLGGIFVGCSDQYAPTGIEQTAVKGNEGEINGLSKVVRSEYDYLWNLGWEPPYENCATGADMQGDGWVHVFVKEKTTPSGNFITRGWVEYGDVTLTNLATGEVWTLTNGHNPFGDVTKENGFYMLHYQWSELYKNDNKQTLHIHLKGHLKITSDGTITHDRESYTCR